MWQRLGKLVWERRAALRLTREELAANARVTSRVLSDIEHARRSNFDSTTLLRLEDALGWIPGSVVDVLNGGDPLLAEHYPPYPIPAEVAALARLLAPESGLDSPQREALTTLLASLVNTFEQMTRTNPQG